MGRHRGRGTQLEVHDGEDPGTWTPVAQISNVEHQDPPTEVEEALDNDSEDGDADFVTTHSGLGEVSFDAHFDPGDASHVELMSLKRNRTERRWRILTPQVAGSTGEELGRYGVLTTFERSSPVEGKLTFSATIQYAGRPVPAS